MSVLCVCVCVYVCVCVEGVCVHVSVREALWLELLSEMCVHLDLLSHTPP